MAVHRHRQLQLELILMVADYLRPLDLLNLVQGIPQIASLLSSRHMRAQDDNGFTIFHLIVEQGLKSLIERLDKWIPRGFIPDNEGWTPLHQAVRKANYRMVKALIDAGSDLSARGYNGKTSLHLACGGNAVEIVRLLLDHGANPSAKDYDERTPLHDAYSHDISVRQMLITAGADLDPRQVPRGLTPLYYEPMIARESVIRILLEAGADPSIQDMSGDTILHRATIHNFANVVRLLLEFGVDITVRNVHGYTPVLVAALGGSDECLRLLLKAGADLSVMDNHGRSALHIAARAGRESTVRLLVKQGMDIAARDCRRGWTPMCWAVNYEQKGVIQVLEDTQTNRFAKFARRVRIKF